jgi:hypothetical protein
MTDIKSCAVCGRTILAGERTRIYLTPEDGREVVCELCRSRAEQLGWVWEEATGERPAPQARPKRRRRGLGSLFGRRESGDDEAVAPAAVAPVEPAARHSPPPEPRPQPGTGADPAAPGAGVGRSSITVGGSPEGRLERAIGRFNESGEARTVAGLTKTLGTPWVSVGAAAGSPSEVRITVAWELCWYQWGVDLKDDLRSVYLIDRGQEMGQLDGPAREWNSRAAEDGRLTLGAPSGS